MAQATPQGQINVVSTSILDCPTRKTFAVATPRSAKPWIMCGDWRSLWISFGVIGRLFLWVMQWHSLGTIRVLKYSSLTQWLGTVQSQF